MKTSDKKKLSLWEKISFGSGDIASCITFNVSSSYLSYYYTDIAGISVAIVGIIMGIARVLEAIGNFLTGIAIDRIDSKKGRTKPILYATSLPLVIMFFLLFVLYLPLSFRILSVCDISVQILYDTCNSISYVLNYLWY